MFWIQLFGIQLPSEKDRFIFRGRSSENAFIYINQHHVDIPAAMKASPLELLIRGDPAPVLPRVPAKQKLSETQNTGHILWI